MAKKTKSEPTHTALDSFESVIAKGEDGNVQITFTIPYSLIEKSKNEAAKELGEDTEVAGFRKGKAPLEKVIGQIPQDILIEKALAKILPKLVEKAIGKHKLKLAIYPKFELLKAQDGQDWQIRAVTCEIPEVDLGDYKKTVLDALRSNSIWTPGKGDPTKPPHAKASKGREEKEQEVIKALLSEIKVSVPKVLIEAEANSRLSQLLARLEKLGLTLESYLASIKKTAVSLRQEYEEQAKRGISLDIILNKIADAENIKIADSQIDSAIAAASSDPKLAESLKTPGQRRVIASILRRRKALDSLVSLL